jgi:hypothetical protein
MTQTGDVILQTRGLFLGCRSSKTPCYHLLGSRCLIGGQPARQGTLPERQA